MKTISATGTITVRRVAAGSKSEQVTVILTTPDRAWLLRTSGQSFGVDPVLADLDGRTVTVTGYAGGSVFLLTEEPVALD